MKEEKEWIPRYWLRTDRSGWRKVTLADFIEAERAAGFFPKGGSGVATAGFTSMYGTKGSVRYDDNTPEER